MIELLEQSEMLLVQVPMRFKRYLYHQIDWSSRLIGIKGARGTGKTTLLLQWLHEQGLSSSKAAYFTLDDLYFSTHSLVETAKNFHKQGGKILALDEVHKYPTWAREIKNLYDLYSDLQIIFTGSSIIDLAKQEMDLSRRAAMYELHGLSYREYLIYNETLNIPPLSINDILNPKNNLRNFFPKDFRPLEHFNHYLKSGYYPFYKESRENYHMRLQQLVRTIIEYDMAELKGFDIRNAKKMLQLISIIAQNVPFKPNLSKLSEKSKIHRNSLANYLYFLEQARLIWLLHPSGVSSATLQKPDKVYLNNTNLMYALTNETISAGTLREVFFCSQLHVHYELSTPQKGDFMVNGKYTFEIGGKSKQASQIVDIKNAKIVKDDLEFPAGIALPLWIFGFVY